MIHANNIRDDDVVGVVNFVVITTIAKIARKMKPSNDS